MSQVGVYKTVAQIICVGLSLSCLPQTSFCTLLSASEARFMTQLISLPLRGLSRVWKPLLSFGSLPGAQVQSHFLYFFFLVVLPGYIEIFPVLSGV